MFKEAKLQCIQLTVSNDKCRKVIIVSNVCPKPTVQNIDHIAYVLLKAAVPLVEDNTADTTQTQQQSSLQGFLQGKLSSTGEERNSEIMRDRWSGSPVSINYHQSTNTEILDKGQNISYHYCESSKTQEKGTDISGKKLIH